MDRTPASRELPALRAEVVRPRPSARPWIILGMAACLGPMMVIAPLLLLRPGVPAPAPSVHVVHVLQSPAAVAPVAEPILPPEPEPVLPGQEFSFVVSTDEGQYMMLEAGDARVERGPARLETDADGIDVVVSDLAIDAVDAELAGWQGREVVVGSETGEACTATVTGFALVGLLRADIGYMALDQDLEPEQLPEAYLTQIEPLVAATLSGCPGRYARLASLPAAAQAEELQDDGIGAAARAALFRSDAAATAQASYDEIYQDGTWYQHEWGQITTRVVRHPATGETFALVHVVMDFACGGADINVLGLYRRGAGGTPEPVLVRDFGDVTSIDQLVDLDGDGHFEIIGDAHFNGPVLLDAAGETRTALSVPFFGCSC